MSAVVVKLTFPILSEGNRIAEVTLRRMTIDDLEHMEKGPAGIAGMVDLIGRLSGLAPSSIKQIDAEDFQTIDKVTQGFLGRSQPTGDA